MCCCLPLVAATSPSLALSRQGLSRPGEQRKQGQTAIDAAETVRIFPTSIITKIIIAKFALLSEFLCTLDTIRYISFRRVQKSPFFATSLKCLHFMAYCYTHKSFVVVLIYKLENSLKICATKFYWDNKG